MCLKLIGIVTSVLTILTSSASVRGAERASEYQLKAAFLYNFANFTTWPDGAFENAEASVVIAVLGTDPFGGDLDIIESKPTTGGRLIHVVRAKSLASLPNCHILYVSKSFENSLNSVVEYAAEHSILTITDIDNACERGVMFGFFSEESKIKFRVNLEAIEASRLRVDPRVLKLGRPVTKETR